MIPADRPHLRVAAVTDPGSSGKNNEDRYAISAYRLGDAASTGDPAGTPSLLALVADGIGGHRAGEVAAELAVETISKVIAASDGSQPVLTLQEAVSHAGKLIYAEAETISSQKGMGSTCAVAWVIGDRLYTVSVGDSRIYLIREGSIRQLTEDHTWIQEAIEHGALSPEQARGHPNAHVIRRYLGSRQPVVPDVRLHLRTKEKDAHAERNQGLHLLPDDCILLCSDGLTDLVEDGEILAALIVDAPEKALQKLVALAKQRGGHDNITALTLFVPALDEGRQPAAAQRPRLAATCAALVLVMLALAALTAGGYWIFSRVQGEKTVLPMMLTATLVEPQATLLPTEAAPQSATATLTPLSPLGNTPLAPAGATLTPWPTNTRPPGP